jgi:hypothetical protein
MLSLLLLLLEGQSLPRIILIMAVCVATKTSAVSAAVGASWGVEVWVGSGRLRLPG